MQYRILESLRYLKSSKRIEAGTISDLKGLSPETIKKLLAKGRIAVVVAPPLAALPGWEEKAVEYAEQGIQDVNDMTGDEDDFDEALEWSAASDDDDYMSSAIVYEVTEDGDMEPANALVDSV